MRSITCTIRFQPDASITLAQEIWGRFTMTVSPSIKFDTFDTRIRAEVVQRLRKDETLLQQAQVERKLVLYETDVYAKHCGFTSIRPKYHGDHKIDILADLFADPTPKSLALKIDINMVLHKPEDHYKNQPPRTQKVHGEQSLEPEDLVQEMNSVDYDHWEYTYIRLGQRPYTQQTAPPNYVAATYIPSSNGTECDDPAVDSWLKTRKEIFVRKLIIGYIFSRYTDNPENFHLTTVEAWDFGDYCIGDKEDDYKKHRVRQNDNYLPAFQGVRLRAQLYTRAMTQVKRYKQGRATPAPVPYMPSYTLNTFDPQRLGLGAPGEKIDAVVRFVDHLDVPYDGRDPVKWLPFNAQWTFDATHDSNFIFKAIMRELKHHAMDDKLKPRESAAVKFLFQEPLKKLWSLQLWALPQPKPGEVSRKMYQALIIGHTFKGSLSDFMSLERIQRGGYGARGLYMEAHIVKRASVKQAAIDAAVREIEEKNEDQEYSSDDSQSDMGRSTGDEES